MNQYVTGSMIKRLRENQGMTQARLAEKLNVSDKAVSKWETGKGYPDISLVEPLAGTLGVSVIELLSGADVFNTNRAFNMQRVHFHVCPICGNVILGTGEAVISCHGIVLPGLEAEAPDESHAIQIETVEDEYFVTIPHEMSKAHFISFAAGVRDNAWELVKLYPEGPAEARFKIGRTRWIYYYCNQHGLFKVSPRMTERKDNR